ncbi:MAG TPA: CpsD/CapB family tyrosine-protein kinase [Blastocatellia bacterium]|nr:CpsD/CapB family tyrosine-protein kinase [Blastocatellia bacterium]
MKESDRPIGRPARVQTPTARDNNVPNNKEPQARTSPVAVPRKEVIPSPPTEVETRDKTAIELPKVAAESSAPFDFSEIIALSEMIAAAPRREVRTQARPRPSRPANDLRVAPATAPVPDFVEPSQRFTISKTAVAPCLTAITGGCERYRTLAMRLLNQAAKRKLKTIVITSARGQEGKSTVATNLAWAMAKPAERRVLLIDANPDQAAVCRMLGVNPQRGWADVIEDAAQISDAIARIDPNGLYLLAAGQEKCFPRATTGRGFDRSDVMPSPRLEKLIADLERHFDFVIIDAPAIKSIGAQRLASIADGTVMVVRAGHTPHNEVTEALKLVPRDACTGVVLNDSDAKEPFTRKDRKTLLARLFSRRA